MFNNLIICIPTYKRKWPAILGCIRLNQDLLFHMFVRKADYEAGYYDEAQFKLDNLKFVPIDGVHELGMTREKMLQYAINNGYEYCMQIDDSQFGLQDITGKYVRLSEIIDACLNRFKTDKYSNKAFGMNFIRNVEDVDSYEQYFLSQMCQTFILNCKVCKQYDLHFYSLDECGLEDLSFIIHAANKGLIELTDSRFIRIGRPGSVIGERGGCHDEDSIDKYRQLSIKRAKEIEAYIMNCSSIKDKQFLSTCESILYPGTTYCKFNCSYARRKLL